MRRVLFMMSKMLVCRRRRGRCASMAKSAAREGRDGGRVIRYVGGRRGLSPRLPGAALLTLMMVLALAPALGLTGCSPAGDGEEEDGASTTATETTEHSGAESSSGGDYVLEGNFKRCPDCHADLDAFLKRTSSLVDGFAHGFHLDSGAQCGECHKVPTHTEEGIRTPTMAQCFGCHSQDDPQAPSGACEVCHPPAFPLEPDSHQDADWLPGAERLSRIQAGHSVGAQEDGEECRECHASSFCLDCHGVQMPHPPDWQDVHADKAEEAGGDNCLSCHVERALCNDCHHEGYDQEGPSWRRQHRVVIAAQGVTPCFECHSTKTCAHCHTTGEYRSY